MDSIAYQLGQSLNWFAPLWNEFAANIGAFSLQMPLPSLRNTRIFGYFLIVSLVGGVFATITDIKKEINCKKHPYEDI